VARSLRYSTLARLDLTAITHWLRQPGAGRAAARRLNAIRVAIRGLRQHPCRLPTIQHPDHREFSSGGGYRIIYRVIPDTGSDETAGDVLVVRIFGPGQSRDRL
jgi:plasmid stabilization system protein ParE